MKKILLSTLILCGAAVMSGCSDFFDVQTDNVLDNDKYITEENEVYSGYIGLMTKMQAIGDKVIYLNEVRGEMVKPTTFAPSELYNLYNYEDDLTGNSYADPAGYYELANACNDYLEKLKAYKGTHTLNDSYYRSLVSSTLRIKAWTFMTLAKTYGEVVWVDKPMDSLEDLSQFKTLDLDETMAACKELLDTGYDGVDGTYDISWQEWLDPSTAGTADSPYRDWDNITPPYYAIYGEICLWLGEYQRCIDVIQEFMNEQVYTNRSQAKFLRGAWLLGKFSDFWSDNTYYNYEVASAISYDSNNRQTNNLLKHFDSESPNEYWLAPSQAGMDRFSDETFIPLGTKEEDWRAGHTFGEQNGNYIICKFRTDTSKPAYEDDVRVFTYRGADMYFMMAEAFNQLGENEEVLDALINHGLSAYSDKFEVDADGVYSGTWNGFTPCWTGVKTNYLVNGAIEITTRGTNYTDLGIRGCDNFSVGEHPFTSDKQANDEEILKEMMMEMSCEGKVYPALIRMARRYNDPSFMAEIIGEKYEETGNAAEIRSKIMNGDYFIHWDLKTNKK